MMEYKGYTAGPITFDDEAEILHGEVAGLRDVVTFQGRNAEELVRAFRESVDDYLEFCAERREEPEEPFSGSLTVRGEPDLHRQIARRAAEEGVSIDQWVTGILRRAVGQR